MKVTMQDSWMWFVVCLVLASCGTNKYAHMTPVNPDQQILGKGIGHELAVQSYAGIEEQEQQKIVLMPAPVLEERSGTRLAASIKAGVYPAIPEKHGLLADKAVSTIELEKNFKKKLIRKYYVKALASKVFGSNETNRSEPGDVILIILAFLLPPLAVGLKVGLDTPFWINLILTLLGWLPGVIHALVVILRN